MEIALSRYCGSSAVVRALFVARDQAPGTHQSVDGEADEQHRGQQALAGDERAGHVASRSMRRIVTSQTRTAESATSAIDATPA